MTTALLQTTYFGPVQWYQKLNRYDHCVIEQHADHLFRSGTMVSETESL